MTEQHEKNLLKLWAKAAAASDFIILRSDTEILRKQFIWL